MKTFKEFIKPNSKKYPTLETVFGKHSQKKDEAKDYPILQTTFGKHSQEKPKEGISEEVRPLKKHIEEYSDAKENSIHKANDLPHSNSIARYSMGSGELNGTLHTLHGKTDKPEDKETISSTKPHIKHLDSLLDKTKIHDNIHVYTGLPHSPAKLFTDKKKGESVITHHPAYISTSTRYDIAKDFAKHDRGVKGDEKHTPIEGSAKPKDSAKHVLKLHLPKGTKGGSIRSQAEFDHENEVLVHRGHNIEIHPHPTIDTDGTHVWHARVVSHTPKHIED